MTYVTLWCDGKTAEGDCGEYLEGNSAAEVRRMAREPGVGRWLVGLPGGRDLCPEHANQREDATRWGDGSRGQLVVAVPGAADRDEPEDQAHHDQDQADHPQPVDPEHQPEHQQDEAEDDHAARLRPNGREAT
jgi:hypothetical protein